MHSIKYISEYIQGSYSKDPKVEIIGICDLKIGKSGYITFLSSEKNIKYLKSTNASAVIINDKLNIDNNELVIIKVDNPIRSFTEVMNLFHPKKKIRAYLDESAIISTTAKVGKTVSINKNVVIDNMYLN